jgi:hypothetical protein
MRRVFLTAALAGGLLSAVPVAAQSSAAPASRPPVTPPPSSANSAGLFVGGIAGAASVRNVGGLFGGELGVRLSDMLDVFGEGLWMQDVVTRRRLQSATTIGAYLQGSQGKVATSTVIAPASYGGGGVRLMFRISGRLRPYFAFGVGGAHIVFKPAFTLSGSDITSSLQQFGIVLGRDLTGEVTRPAFTGSVGVRLAQARWYVDGGFRVLSIRTSDQPTNVLQAGAAVGFRF